MTESFHVLGDAANADQMIVRAVHDDHTDNDRTAVETGWPETSITGQQWRSTN